MTELLSNSEAFDDTGGGIPIDAANNGVLPKTLVIDCEEMFRCCDARQILESEGLIREVGKDHIDDTVRQALVAMSEESAHAGGGWNE
jgi:hypothetical protein